MIITEWLFKERIDNNFKSIYNPKTLKQIAGEIINIDDKELNGKLAKMLINPYF